MLAHPRWGQKGNAGAPFPTDFIIPPRQFSADVAHFSPALFVPTSPETKARDQKNKGPATLSLKDAQICCLELVKFRLADVPATESL